MAVTANPMRSLPAFDPALLPSGIGVATAVLDNEEGPRP
jgi:hypothetical protein